MNRILLLLAALAALISATPARASGDVGCEPSMRVFSSSFTGCDSMGLLSPGNDTRVNLTFLMADRKGQALSIVSHDQQAYPQPSLFTPQGWDNFSAAILPDESSTGNDMTQATVCVSASKGQADFEAAVAAEASLSAAEKDALKAARDALSCSDGTAKDAKAPAAPDVQSPAAKDFAAYLAAITQFYQVSHFDGTAFAALATSSQPWVKEAARYMQARVALLAAQAEAFDDYGTLAKDKVDGSKLAAARDALNAYLKDYPTGAYAASATGLLRRVAWLAGAGDDQIAAYAKLLADAKVDEASVAVINELDFKLAPESYLAPGADSVFLAVQDLREMRDQLDDKGKPKPGMKAEVLAAQKDRFAGQDALYGYLQAARAWFVDHDAKAVVQLLPEEPASGDLSYLAFSRQLLRAAALDASGDGKAAQAAFLALVPHATSAYQRPTLEMALAMSDERNTHIALVFDQGSPIKSPEIRTQVLDQIAGPILLRQQATAKDVTQDERDTALFRLLERDLVHGRFRGFLDDITLLPPKPEASADATVVDKFGAFRWDGQPDGYRCPALVDVAQKLAANARDVQGRLCLGEFFRSTGIANPDKPGAGALGSTGTLFAGTVLSRGDFYADIMKDAKAPREARAYALFRAVNCYAPSHQNDCGGKDVELPVRKAWHDELKAKYGDTDWAQQLEYYW